MSAWEDKLRSKAADPETSPQLLEHWSAHRELRPVLATNPNMPPETLFNLIHDCPREFLANPVLPLLYLSDPSLFTYMESDDALRLLMYEEIPTWLLAIFTQHFQAAVRDTVQHHIGYGNDGASDEQAAIMAIQQAPIERDNSAKLPALPCDGWLIPVLAEHQAAIIHIAQFKGTPPELLARLAEHEGVNVRQAAMDNRQTPLDVLARLAEHPDARIRAQIAQCRRTPTEVLERLMSDPHVSVRVALAGR
ncbi:MAG TPA: hypothetical protein VKB76_19760, partial [Ktedonobacterales bacterium]|nr:hypothetical protein [Ktedonobacterales bacterium]